MTLIAGVVAVVVLYLLLQMFRAANPAVLARALKTVGGVVALLAAVFIGVRGQFLLAMPLAVFGAGLLGYSPKSLRPRPCSSVMTTGWCAARCSR